MRILYFLLLCAFLNSCKYIENQVPTEKELLEKELQTINWNKVDVFPSIGECDKIENKTQQQQCFFEVITQLIQNKLRLDTLSKLYPELDSFELKVIVLPNSTVHFEPRFIKDSISTETKILSSIVKARLINFPKVNPAIKRGVPVKTQFTIPLTAKSK